jgi:phosphatidate cytidylyltransferase
LSKAPDIAAPPSSPSSGTPKLRFSLDWVTRPVFGVALAALAIVVIIAGVWPFAVLAAVTAVAAAREWHRMVEHSKPAREFWISALFFVASLIAIASAPRGFAAWTILVLGSVVALFSTAQRGGHPLWHASGVLYIGVPALLLVMLRASAPHAVWVLLELFLIVWATDTGALIAGNVIGGPRLTPVLSPNKTWSGTLGGMAAAAAVAAILVYFLHGNAAKAALLGVCLSAIAHGGDLFESWVKRQFQLKDSGGLIPGHGGVLDRIDSTLAAATAMSVTVFLLDIDPTFGAHA